MITGATRKPKNINIEMPVEFYEAFTAHEKRLGFSTHLSFLEQAMGGNTQVCWVDFVTIDGQSPASHSAMFYHGEALYHFRQGGFRLIGDRTEEQPIKRVLE